jgi:hypothetical protein
MQAFGMTDIATPYEILRGLCTSQEAEVGSRNPIRFTDLEGVARRTGKTS